MSVIPRALENPSLDDGFWQIRTFAATWLNGIFWSTADMPLAEKLPIGNAPIVVVQGHFRLSPKLPFARAILYGPERVDSALPFQLRLISS